MALTRGLALRSLSTVGFRSTKATSQLVAPLASPLVLQVASISRGPKKWPKVPFPYKRLNYNMMYRLFWPADGHLDPNESKVIVVEGNCAVGKSGFAKELAQRLDFKMFDEPEILSSYFMKPNPKPVDPRAQTKIDQATYHLPEFYSDPNRESGKIVALQFEILKARFFNYCDALNHLYSTGQGVVIVRSPFSDRAFMETFFDFGFLPAEHRTDYSMFQYCVWLEIQTPHLAIYLDASKKYMLDRIKERGIPYELENLDFTKDFIGKLDYHYKTTMLPYYELLSYKWDEEHDWDGILDDIESLDFEATFDPHKFKSWKFPENDFHAQMWSFYSNRDDQADAIYRNIDYDLLKSGILSGHDIYESSLYEPSLDDLRKLPAAKSNS